MKIILLNKLIKGDKICNVSTCIKASKYKSV